ncbi:MAG: sulfite exporter TauE/SafE family protein [Gemmatimonadetes bacterium]|nr:sulfite exporter TauE/SafE family protein [Gemmatimonadota bacterium]MCA9763586.1 sulfite exporter TauE/SafE family protein [Gemmatimonadota bacterium]MCB9505203.1 sulfite exporter TauE/SafE family protein [Gemmatimonadales bacterium]MCB9518326.1 sulfite exporter TauE/SafE family protein [Gemmatimonadales bacterium]
MLDPALDAALADRPLVALGLLFAAGVATSLTPCIYPMIPITAGVLGGAGAATRSRRRTAALTAMYVLGLALVYATLGLVAGMTGTLFGTISSNPWAYFTFGNLLLLAALAMLDVIPLRAPQRVLAWAGRLGGDSVGGAFLLGATSGLVAAPCGAPAFAAVLTWVASTRSAVWGFTYLFVFSLGMTALLVVVGLASGTLAALPRAGTWTLWIKRLGAIIMLAMAEYYFVKMGTTWF